MLTFEKFCQDENGFDALMVAAAGGHDDVLTALLKGKADPNHMNKASGTALHEAAGR